MTHPESEELAALGNAAEHDDAKQTNPKDAIGSKKLPMHLVPDTLSVYAAMAFAEGALKYGKFNWRRAGVRASIYIDALDRHFVKFKNGEWADKETQVPHLANMLACIGILIDAHECGMLTDDRPPPVPGMVGTIHFGEVVFEHLRNIFKDHTPHQHVITDENPGSPQGEFVL